MDYCQDKTSQYDIRPAETDLMHAAIALAERLLEYQLTASQRSAITEMLAFLRNLPAPPPAGLNGEFGFEFRLDSEQDDGGHAGAWMICVCRGLFEVFGSGYEPLTGFSWELCPGKPNRNDLTHAHKWIEQVTDPYGLLPKGHQLIIAAETWTVSAESACCENTQH
ncbi:hypothetical protein ACS8MQ_08800 [Pseudomonas sp. MAHUQ-62]|uniref:hypothetical protein n=1 Tax=Pseudomonas sp. GCM10023245 TaxID=3252652 RepID=UPI00361334A2